MRYEKTISRLEMKYHMDINAVRSEYSNKIKEQSHSIELMKKNHLDSKKVSETKIIDLEE